MTKEKKITENQLEKIKKILEVFQICDSTFPIGTFNHSYGMETYLRDNKVTDNDSFEKWLGTFLQTQFKWGEGLLVKLALEALQKGNVEKIWQYDKEITLSTSAIETRKGAKLIALQMIELILQIYDDASPEIKLIKEYQEKINNDKAYGNPAIVFAIFMKYKDIPVFESTCYYGYSIVTTMVQNAVRTIPLGQKSGQRIMHDIFDVVLKLCEEISQLDERYLGANVPGIEMSQIRHETTVFRLFMS